MSTTTNPTPLANPVAGAPKRALPPLMQLTEAAAARLRGLYEKGEAGRTLRITVSTKGCSGHAYVLEWVDAAGPGDEAVTDKGVTVLIDRKASLFLIGTTMDWREQKLSAGFEFINPNEKGRCGCGESFHV
jgi:iron-sulfur cluster assembly protein